MCSVSRQVEAKSDGVLAELHAGTYELTVSASGHPSRAQVVLPEPTRIEVALAPQ